MKQHIFSNRIPSLRLKKAVCLTLSLAVLQLSGYSSLGHGKAAEHTPLAPEVSSQLQQILDAAATDKAAHYPGVILRLETPQGTWSGTSGVSNVKTNSPIDPQAKFRAGSILKPFIATVILQLMENEQLSLDDRLPELLPAEIAGLFEYGDSITLRMLLNHTSGIGEWVGDYESIVKDHPMDKVWQDSEFLDMAVKAGTNFKPGEKWLYNNTEFTLLGMIIEQKTGVSWRENVRQRIFTKLELKNTLLPEPGNVKMPGSYINGYEMFSGVLTDTTEVDASMAGAAGGHSLVTNTEDLSIFIQALLSGSFFKNEETLSAMLTTVETGGLGRSYGLGIGRYALPNGSYAYGHTGGTAGYATFMFHFPEEGITATSVITTDQGDAITSYLFPSLGVVAESSTLH